VELMEGVEDIPGVALHEGLSWNWESFADFMDVLENRPHDIDMCAQLPHGALRVYVMGERATRLEAATPEDIVRMRELTCEAMRAGAIGFSTSRSMNHRTIKGDPTPMLRAAEDELMGIALGMADAGSGVFQVISDFNTPSAKEEFAMLRRIVEHSGRPMSISLAQAHSSPTKWRFLLDLIAEAVADGLPMKAQVAPRPIGVLLGLQGSLNPFSACPSYVAIKDKPLAERVALMREDAQLKQRLLAEIDSAPTTPFTARLTSFHNMFPFGDPPDYSPSPDTSIGAQAEGAGRAPAELAYERLLQDDGRSFLFAPFANFANGNLDACQEMIADANTVIGLGDGGAHVSIISDGSFPTYLLSYWGRERKAFDMSWLVKRQTSDTARMVGLLDRGILAPGMKADVNLIDVDMLGLHAPRMQSDLPAGGRRLLQGATGYVATIVSGKVVYRDGEHTGELPGRLVRGPQPAAGDEVEAGSVALA
nr:amidohydrolase family protein [Pseudomonas sp.]